MADLRATEKVLRNLEIMPESDKRFIKKVRDVQQQVHRLIEVEANRRKKFEDKCVRLMNIVEAVLRVVKGICDLIGNFNYCKLGFKYI